SSSISRCASVASAVTMAVVRPAAFSRSPRRASSRASALPGGRGRAWRVPGGILGRRSMREAPRLCRLCAAKGDSREGLHNPRERMLVLIGMERVALCYGPWHGYGQKKRHSDLPEAAPADVEGRYARPP